MKLPADVSRVKMAVIVPVYNGRPYLTALCARLVAALSEKFDSFRIVLVDDGDPTGSWDEIEALAKNEPRIAGIRLSRNFGQHAAIGAGIDAADADWYVVMDCDLQDPPEQIGPLYQAALAGNYDIVIAKRQGAAQGRRRRLASRVFYLTLRCLSDLDLSPDQGNFRIFSRQVADALRQMHEQMRLVPALMARLGYHVGTLGLPRAARAGGASSYSWGRLVRLAYEAIIANSEKPLIIAVISSAIFCAGTLLFAFYVILKKLLHGVSVDGWTSLIVAVCLIGGVQLFLTSIVGLYVGRTFNEAKARPHYLIKSRINI